MALDTENLSTAGAETARADAEDVTKLIARLSSSHDLTAAEAAEIIADWQAGLSLPLDDLAA